MKASCAAACFLILTLASPATAEVPDLAWGVAEAGRQAPMWVAADKAVSHGRLDGSLFLPAIRQSIEHHMWVVRDRRGGSQRSAGETDCAVNLEPSSPALGRYKGAGVESIAEASAQVMTGVVTAAKQGFLYGNPGTLYEIALDAPESATAGSATGVERLFVFLRIADFAVEDVRFCSGVMADRAPPVVGGSAVLAFETDLDDRVLGHTEEGAPILQPLGYEVFLETTGGRASAPGRYKDEQIDVERLRIELPERWRAAKASGAQR